ncbi:MAG: redox-regulated ATPase YchF [Candidatus Izemoplasmatales bacterium]|nr:redox-regulated ATPase YchF [Candidatus Izemoplasmatales bacterium]
MGLKAGIIGLPNVGKTTLFNAVIKAKMPAINYPFATIEPNVGVVEVPDWRMEKLIEIYKPRKVVYTSFELTDVAGLVRGSSKGEGLGNQFLSYIRSCDSLCQVVRCFDDSDVIHVEGTIDPIRDIETIQLELIFADLEVVEKRLPKIEKRAQTKADNEAVEEYHILKRIHDQLMDEKPIRSLSITKEEQKIIKNFSFLTAKPMLYVCNISESELENPEQNEAVQKIKERAKIENARITAVSAKIEQELSELEEADRLQFMAELEIKQSGLDDLIRKTYDLLGLETFFTASEKEVRSWTFRKGMKAPECGGVIHSDFEKGFIRAETIAFLDLLSSGSETKAKELGKYRLEGKEYVAKDGDIFHFRFNL